MQACDLLCNSSLGNTFRPDSPIMSDYASSPILNDAVSSPENHRSDNNSILQNDGASTASSIATRNHRPPRACTARAAARLQAANQQAVPERKHKSTKKEQRGEEPASPQPPQCKIVTPLVSAPLPPSQQPRWTLRLMWELASVLNFLHLFRPLLNINAEFSAEEFETALLNPNATLADIHMPLLKAIPPITRMALGRGTWITVLCRKLRDWWHWVAEGELPIVASHGAEVDVYHALDPSVRLVILKALCDIRVEQEDIRNYIDSSIKHGVHLSAFRKERIGGDSHGISYWYEDDALIGHRLYREIRKVDVKKAKVKGSQVMPSMLYHWETVATSLDEFQDVSEKLFTSKNRTEASLGKKLKIDMLPEIEKVHKRKERLLKKQHREALLLDNCLNVDGLAAGRSLRDRKRVTYTFDDYDRSISEAIKITKRKQPSPEHLIRREFIVQSEASANGKLVGPSEAPQQVSSNCQSPMSPDFDDANEEHKSEPPNRRNRRRQRPQRYSDKEFVGTVLDNDIETGSDDDIVGEAIYDDEYMQQRKQRKKFSSSSEGDEEYHLDEENADEEEEEEEEEESFSVSEDSVEPPRSKKLHGRTRRETKLRSVEELQSGLRRSKRATRNCINYRQYELSESETDSIKPEKSNASDHRSDGSDNEEYSMDSKYSDDNGVEQERRVVVGKSVEDFPTEVEKEQNQPFEKENSSPGEDESDGERKGRFLDLNELAPGSGFDDGQHSNQR